MNNEVEITIYADDKGNYPFVTMEEMEDLAKTEPYKPHDESIQLSLNKENGLYYTRIFTVPWLSNALVNHLMVEKCMQQPDKIDWAKTTNYYDYSIIADIMRGWLKPLIWQPVTPDIAMSYIIVGKVAYPKLHVLRYKSKLIDNWMWDMIYEKVLFFADHRPTYSEDVLSGSNRHMKDMLAWDFLMVDPLPFLHDARQPDYINEHKLIYFSPEAFRNQLLHIVEQRGEKVAAELVKLFREDWQSIVSWKLFNIDMLSTEQVEEFRACLFEGMEADLRKWETEMVSPQKSEGRTSCFPLLTDQCRKEGKLEAVEAELRAACKSPAPALWKTIHTNEALGYLPTRDWAASKIYRTFADYFGELPYNERNFRDARNKK